MELTASFPPTTPASGAVAKNFSTSGSSRGDVAVAMDQSPEKGIHEQFGTSIFGSRGRSVQAAKAANIL
jgi:hypothetical protein